MSEFEDKISLIMKSPGWNENKDEFYKNEWALQDLIESEQFDPNCTEETSLVYDALSTKFGGEGGVLALCSRLAEFDNEQTTALLTKLYFEFGEYDATNETIGGIFSSRGVDVDKLWEEHEKKSET